ncbi:unnamed protein product, partial [Staurois parvus]
MDSELSFRPHIQSLSKACLLNLSPSSLDYLYIGYPPLWSIIKAAARLIHLINHSVSATPLCQSLHWPPLSVLHPSLPIPPLASTQCPPSLFAIPPLASI